MHFILEMQIRKYSVHLHANRLKPSSFAINSLLHFNRPTKLYLYLNRIKYFNENFFQLFFDATQLNEIKINKECFDIEHKQNQWNQTDQTYKNRINIIDSCYLPVIPIPIPALTPIPMSAPMPTPVLMPTPMQYANHLY